MMARYRRKDLKHDEFKETIEDIIVFYEHHKKTVLWLATGIVILLVILFTYKSNKQTKMAESKEMYNMGVILYNSGNFSQARDRFQTVVDKYWGTAFANRSKFMLANISYKEGNLDDALDKFQDFVNGNYDGFFTPSSYQGIGQCYEQKGDLVKAIDNYRLAADKFKDNFSKAECLLSLARLYLGQQQTDEAEIALKKIFEISEDAEVLEEAKEKLKLVQVQKELNE
ncbi:tetratricopeptide repeat protein [candidate division WOR-3 bacterium]|nr:tetratricopeptide repeat protein [candidate division WOR-3 bacterium]